MEYIESLVNYEGADVKSLKQSFEEAVDDYLDLCKQEGLEPEQPFKGSLTFMGTGRSLTILPSHTTTRKGP